MALVLAPDLQNIESIKLGITLTRQNQRCEIGSNEDPRYDSRHVSLCRVEEDFQSARGTSKALLGRVISFPMDDRLHFKRLLSRRSPEAFAGSAGSAAP